MGATGDAPLLDERGGAESTGRFTECVGHSPYRLRTGGGVTLHEPMAELVGG